MRFMGAQGSEDVVGVMLSRRPAGGKQPFWIPLTVLRRFDCILAPTNVAVLEEHAATKPKVGYEIPLNRHFYRYEPPRPLEAIKRDIRGLEQEIVRMLKEVTA
jgi:type I restriction-modification system DNA methylase subunit